MNGLLTLLLPGLGQMLRGDLRKAATIFGTAVITGVMTGGAGWVACGVWSMVDFNKAPASGAAASPKDGGSSAPGRSASEGGTSMAWVFKFATLSLCGAIVFYTIRSGSVLQSLEFVGVKLQFGSALANQAERSEGEAKLSGVATGGVLPSTGGNSTAPADPPPVVETSAIEPPAARAGEVLDVAGSWRNAEGATYELRQDGDQVAIREISRIVILPVETATCQGTVSGATVTAACRTYLGTTGEIQLAAAGGGLLVGEYRDHTTGARVPIQLSR